MAKEESGLETIAEIEEKVRVKRPKLYQVIMHNDDYTTMEFVVSVLENIFKKTPAEATQIMLSVHKQGFGRCGVFARDIAEVKVRLVHQHARERGYPLRCSIEEA